MSTPARELIASINGVGVGVLRDEADIWSFEYDAAWTQSADGFDRLAPGIARSQGKIVDGGSARPIQWFFDNLLPEEQARELLTVEITLSAEELLELSRSSGSRVEKSVRRQLELSRSIEPSVRMPSITAGRRWQSPIAIASAASVLVLGAAVGYWQVNRNVTQLSALPLASLPPSLAAPSKASVALPDPAPVQVRNPFDKREVPGSGCVFTIDLPRYTMP